ncbi:unnamed protein product [Protopolystoma xenopodis]|uniref:Uncharacterized protein n=1 Tax=Protopolystoma xenopodis TaxID=117903 RepID=A0A448WL28_9PLAT|nr:unnamed protein product [Protopolystoma xenopodis]
MSFSLKLYNNYFYFYESQPFLRHLSPSIPKFSNLPSDARTTQWEDPRLELLGGPAVPYSRNYKQKYEYFRSRLRAPRDSQAKFEIRVTREGVFEDSFRLIYGIKKPEVLMHR